MSVSWTVASFIWDPINSIPIFGITLYVIDPSLLFKTTSSNFPSLTLKLYVIEGDNEIVEEFDPSFKPDKYSRDAVYVWRAKNGVNDLVYGYSGIKLFPTERVLAVDPETVVDFTMSISTKFVAYQKLGSIVRYDTDPFNTW